MITSLFDDIISMIGPVGIFKEASNRAQLPAARNTLTKRPTGTSTKRASSRVVIAAIALIYAGGIGAETGLPAQTHLIIRIEDTKPPALDRVAAELRAAVPSSSVVLSRGSGTLQVLTQDQDGILSALDQYRVARLPNRQVSLGEVVSKHLRAEVQQTVPKEAIRYLLQEAKQGRMMDIAPMNPECAALLDVIGTRSSYDALSGSASLLPSLPEFDAACFAKITPPDFPKQLPPGFRSGDPSKAIGSLSLATSSGKHVFCVALLLSPRVILTARHCFFEFDGQKNPAYWGLQDKHVTFTRASAPYTEMRVTPLSPFSAAQQMEFGLRPIVSESESQFSLPEDLVVLLLEDDIGPVPALRIAQTASGRGAFLAGPLDVVPVEPGTSVPAPVRALRWDRNPSCRTITQVDACTRHTCQAFMGFSGSPLFVEPSDGEGDGLVVAGIHVAPATNGSGCEGLLGSSTSMQGNVAIAPAALSRIYGALTSEGMGSNETSY